MRKKWIGGNWKMHGVRANLDSLVEAIKSGVKGFTKADIAIFPSYVYLQQIENLLVDTQIAWGGQNLYLGAQGAYTGEISGPMLVDYGCQYVLVGHSERRTVFQESSAFVAKKVQAALEFGLQPVLCIGETLAEHEKGMTESVLAEQLETVIQVVGIEVFRRTIIAYEPVWAIGTGLTATPEVAQNAHAFIRGLLSRHHIDIAKNVRILYGGSVKADNARGLFAMPDIDGGLIGGASLDPKSFIAICEAAERA